MSSFISRFGGNMATRQTGLAALKRAFGSGLTINNVRDQLAREGVTPGPAGMSYLTARSPSAFVSKYGGNTDTMRMSGLNGLKRAAEDLGTLNKVRQAASSQGISWGPAAQQFFQSRGDDKFISQYGGNIETFDSSGMAAVNRALAAGLSPQDISERGVAENITWGPEAANFLKADKDNRDRLTGLSNQLTQQQQANEDLVAKFAGIEDDYKKDLAGLNSTISDLQKSYADQQSKYIDQLQKANNTYNPTTSVGTSAGLGGFSPNSKGTPMSIKQQGTGRFNRDNRRRNTLNINNINV